MYDYNSARFLSVDPFIQAPTSTQSMNPYTYIFNNPLSGIDPTGYLADLNLDQEVNVQKVERFAPTGSNIKSGVKFSGVTASGNKFTLSVSAGGEIVSSSGLSGFTSQGASLEGSSSSEDIGNNDTIAQKGGAGQGEDKDGFFVAVYKGLAHLVEHPEMLEQPIRLAGEQITEATGGTIDGHKIVNATGAGDAVRGLGLGANELSKGDIAAAATTIIISMIESKAKLPKVGGGASLDNLSLEEIQRIQNAANRTKQKITLIGSRAESKGGNGAASDYDYILSGNSSQRHSASSSLPRGTQGGSQNSMGNETGIDIFQDFNSNAPSHTTLDENLPHIIFTPEK